MTAGLRSTAASPAPSAPPRVRATRPADDAGIRELAAAFGWPSRRGLVLDGVDVAPIAAAAEATHGLAQDLSFVAHAARAVAATAIEPDPWASGHLGVALGRFTTVSSTGGTSERFAAVGAVLGHAVEGARDAGLDVLVCRLDADDRVTADACTARGFRLVDTEVVYLADARHAAPASPRAGLEVTVHDRAHPPELTGAERARLLDRAAGFRGSHIGADLRIPAEGSARFYRAWTENALDGRWGDVLAVARTDAGVVGCFSWVLDHDLVAAGCPAVLHRSWAVVSSEGLGAFGAMLSKIASGGSDGHGVRFTECDTQTSNDAVNRAFARLAGARRIRRSLVFHRWTDDVA